MSEEPANHFHQRDNSRLTHLCEKWKILRLELFGSQAHVTANDNSDIDLLVTFMPEAHHSLMELVEIEWELSKLLGKKVDLVERAAVEQSRNPFRKEEILASAKLLYAA